MKIDEPTPGRPAQFVLSTPSPPAVQDYYAAVFDWSVRDDGELSVGGQAVGRIATGAGGWLPYLAVTDLAGALREVRAAGGTVAEQGGAPPGRSAVVTDPTATPLGLWEVGSGPAARLWAEDGAAVWVEQKTHDQPAATTFLAGLLGVSFLGGTGPGSVRLIQGDGPFYGGVMQFDGRWAPDEMPHWLLYLQTDDADAATERGLRAGGSTWFPAFDTPLGRMAYLRDPAGNAFAAVALSEQGFAMVNG